MAVFRPVSDLSIVPIWDGIAARAIEGRTMTFAVVELDPNTPVQLHEHPNEQMGIVLTGSLRFAVGAEVRDLGPGDTYLIPGGVPHEARSGPSGAVVVDVFSPVREDWRRFTPQAPRPGTWP
jgi:quercetin dioxygenase-like cupin family protein